MAARRLNDLLRRFRPAAAPGAAAPAGVPSDVIAGLEAELAVVFASLDDARRQAESIRADGRNQARQRADRASAAIGSIEADGLREAGRARAEVSSERAQRAVDARRRWMSEAEQEAALIDARAGQRMTGMVDRVIDVVLAAGHPPGGTAPGPGEGSG